MIIKIDTTGLPLTELEEKVLRVLLGEDVPQHVPADGEVVVTPEPTAVAARKSTKATRPKPEPQDEPQDDSSDDSGDAEPTLDDAVERATALVSAGKLPKVKAALKKLGVKRVSELDAGDVASFLDDLKGE